MRAFRHIIAVLLALVAASCSTDQHTLDLIDHAEQIIEEQPDSALIALQQIDPESLRCDADRAKHSLLLSMALDKNYIDKVDFEVLQPAIDYYSDNGDATCKLRTLYYKGRIYQNRNETTSAMLCYFQAIADGASSDDILTKARIYFAQTLIYFNLYNWDSHIESSKCAAELFKAAGRYSSYAKCVVEIINGYDLSNDPDNAKLYIEEAKKLLNKMNNQTIRKFYSAYLIHLNKYGSKEEIRRVVEEIEQTLSASQIDYVSLANSYLQLGEYDKAYDTLHLMSIDDNEDKERYYATLTLILYHQKEYKKAYDTYYSFNELSNAFLWSTLQQNIELIEEQHSVNLKAAEYKAQKDKNLYIGIIITITLTLVIILIVWLLRVKSIKQRLTEQESKHYRLLYEQMTYERDNLSELLSNNNMFNDSIKAVVAERLDLLNKFFSLYIANKHNSIDTKFEEIITNKDEFINSTRLAFTASHPNFIKYFEDHNLTEREIGYCCLYALGLNGKEIGTYMQMRSHYNISSEVRTKLGLESSDTNLSIHIRNMLNSL